MAWANPSAIWSIGARVLAAAATAGAIVFVFYTRAPQPVAIASRYADACAGARTLAQRALANEAVRGIELGDCADFNLREQKDLSWLANGKSAGTRYGAPVTLEWSARVAAFPEGMRLCNFGFDASSNPRTPAALTVDAC
jgi:hypothetical protein